MHVLITRPEDDARVLGQRLVARQHRVSIAPLITIEFLPIAEDLVRAASALIATSRNGLKALERFSQLSPPIPYPSPPAGGELATTFSQIPYPLEVKGQRGEEAHTLLAAIRDVPLYVVGPGTAKVARDLGFRDVIEGAGTARALAEVIRRAPAAHLKRPLQLAGADLAFDLAAALAGSGILIDTVTAYRAVAATSLPADTEVSLARGDIDAVMLMSPRTAAVWHALLKGFKVDSALRQSARSLIHLCLSPAVAEALGGIESARVEVALEPHSEALLALVDHVAASSPKKVQP